MQTVSATFPARGTWIEILLIVVPMHDGRDVPRKGNVDRNITDNLPNILESGRSPQGERG